MSQQPPPDEGLPTPYPHHPSGQDPYNQGPYGPAPSGRPGGMSNKAKFWIGVALTLPVMFLVGVVTGGSAAALTALGADSGTSSTLSSILALLLLAGFVACLVLARTRWFALGVLAGSAMLLILAAGACVVLLVGLSQSSFG